MHPESVVRTAFEYSWPELSILLRIGVAGVCGAIVGWERESSGKAAGLRTHIVVSIASALFAGVSLLLMQSPRFLPPVPDGDDGQRNVTIAMGSDADLIRAVQSVAVGVGFLGAGVIFVQRPRRARSHVRGLTTAASIWSTSAIGLAAGFGFFVLSIGTTLLVWISLGLAGWESSHAPADDDPDDPLLHDAASPTAHDPIAARDS